MQIFLSHASPSKMRVRRIVERLPKHIDCWLDQDELSPGYRFGRHIETAIAEECDFLIVFVDEAALNSDWVRRETEIGLQREADLGRPFVVPVLLADVRAQISQIGPLADRLCLDACDTSEVGVASAAERLAEQLFALTSRMIVTQRGLGRRGLLDAFARELSAYKQVAYMWRQLLGNTLSALSTNQALFDQVAAAVKDYNRVSDDFFPRLTLHRDRLTSAWSEHRGLCDDVRELVEQVEEQVYRGAMLRLNRVHEMVHALVAGGAADAATLGGYGAEQQAILTETAEALEDMSKRSTHLISALEREI